MAKVFLSYAREDAPAAKELAECIGHAGHHVWWFFATALEPSCVGLRIAVCEHERRC